MTAPDPVVKRGYRETVVLEDGAVAQVVADAGDRAQAIAAHLTETARRRNR